MFSDSRCKNACKMLADLCPCFDQSPTRPNFGRSRVKVCPILCCLRARLCPIYFAPCPFPNLAGTLTSSTTTATGSGHCCILNNCARCTLIEIICNPICNRIDHPLFYMKLAMSQQVMAITKKSPLLVQGVYCYGRGQQ